mmetsp:Transcript_37645/g.45406  ORF Transcript_37645/g.45406 Transcript_37645/m.45406 type:complete len:576 (+) Transcript_37645:192-1919(+)|eukprot:CAMPEP_0197853034 /NCGR_PEP_ID=MMETSP1438-20131217/21948_1 /TAXON_ID=1461541 /ORGANISM="Pterosperma sp., Strain CCMP1384" /LENGTH=575 /DNA_ID=CAMNT_0043467297 /DNA_START=192 /DNA_END=1919 /DNA_ORIENTATION=+
MQASTSTPARTYANFSRCKTSAPQYSSARPHPQAVRGALGSSLNAKRSVQLKVHQGKKLDVRSTNAVPTAKRGQVSIQAYGEVDLMTMDEGVAAENYIEGAPTVLIAGGGIGGLVTALACKNKGMNVKVFERVTKYKPFGGPIQLQCNAIGALEAIDPELAAKVIAASTTTGDRINGLMDGITGDWFFRFDTRQPCFRNGLPLTLVINRFTLLQILVDELQDYIVKDSEVVAYTEDESGITAILGNGKSVVGDVLVGADGIRSLVRKQMRNEEQFPLVYSGYTVYTATCSFTGKLTDTDKVGYQIFLGNDQYFVASDVGDSKQQWYAFHKEPPGGKDNKCMKEQLVEYFEGWDPKMQERLTCTLPEEIERRDVYDIRPTITLGGWTKGRVCLLGDAIHAVQPNLGQGGGQAIESAYTLSSELGELLESGKEMNSFNIQVALNKYASRRVLRAGAIHGLSRMAALMNIVYRRNLGSYPYSFYPQQVKDFWDKVEKLNIPHPGRVVGQIGMMVGMDAILEYVGSGFTLPQWLGGSAVAVAHKQGERVPYCSVPGISSPKRPLKDEDFKMRGLPGLAE